MSAIGKDHPCSKAYQDYREAKKDFNRHFDDVDVYRYAERSGKIPSYSSNQLNVAVRNAKDRANMVELRTNQLIKCLENSNK